MKWLPKKCLIISALFALQTAGVILFQSYENITWFSNLWERAAEDEVSQSCHFSVWWRCQTGRAGSCPGRHPWEKVQGVTATGVCQEGRDKLRTPKCCLCSSLNESASQPGTLWKGEVEGISWNITWAMLQSDSKNKWEFKKVIDLHEVEDPHWFWGPVRWVGAWAGSLNDGINPGKYNLGS